MHHEKYVGYGFSFSRKLKSIPFGSVQLLLNIQFKKPALDGRLAAVIN